MKRDYYFYRGDMIERWGDGWTVLSEMINGDSSGIPVYRTIADAKNAINKFMDGTHKAEPRILKTLSFDMATKRYYENQT